MNTVQERGKPFDADEKTAIENMPFFLEGLAQRVENEECPVLPKLCRAVATEIERLQAENERLKELGRTKSEIIEGLLKGQELADKVVEAAKTHIKKDNHYSLLDVESALAALKKQT